MVAPVGRVGSVVGVVGIVVVGLLGMVVVGVPGEATVEPTMQALLLTRHEEGVPWRESPTAVMPKLTDAPGATVAFQVSLLT